MDNKAFKNLNEYPDEWIVMETNDPERGAIIVRVNVGIKEAVGHPSYPIRMGIAAPFDSNTSNDPIFDSLEDKIITTLEQENRGCLALILTGMEGKMFKEYLCYVRENLDSKQLLHSFKSEYPSLDLQIYTNQDPEWEGYKIFSSS